MKSTKKHVLRTDETPTFRGIGQLIIDSAGLVEYLNQEPSSRVVELATELKSCRTLAQEFCTLTQEFIERAISSGESAELQPTLQMSPVSGRDVATVRKELNDSRGRLNSLLPESIVCPMIIPPVGCLDLVMKGGTVYKIRSNSGRWVMATWIPVRNGKPMTSTPGLGRCEGLATALDELNSVLTLLTLANQGAIDRIRRCERCAKWFYGRKIQQRFCSEKCQQSSFRDSDRWKSGRKEYMRRYRRVLRERELAALHQVRAQRSKRKSR